MSQSEDIDYRAGFGRVPESMMEEQKPSGKDQADYSTLREVYTILTDYVEGLSKDFDAFTILEGHSPEAAAQDLLVQIKVKKGVREELKGLIDILKGAIDDIESINNR